MANIF